MTQDRDTVAAIQADSVLILKLQYEIASMLAQSGSVQGALLQVLEKIALSGGWDTGIAWLLNDQHFDYQCEWHKPAIDNTDLLSQSRTAAFANGTLLCRTVLNSGKLVWVDDISANKRFPKNDAAIRLKMRNAMAFPLRYSDNTYGVIELFRGSAHRLDDDAQEVFTALGDDIGQFLEARRLYEERLEQFALHDALTGLANRILLTERGNRALLRAERNGDSIAVLYTDLDHFKAINDQHGFVIGDQVLRLVAERLGSVVRNSDTVARFGGDEFVILLPEVADADHAAIVAQKILANMAKPFLIGKLEFRIDISIGISRYPHDGHDMPTLLRRADESLYRVKQSGRNNYAVCDDIN
ncbi:sensor domain-containing diguanylate cyclase [Alcaligenaceae bacterium]|nr:sensor domain-containing diguanylate cyclase [Alcaligenaceae bacterium]